MKSKPFICAVMAAASVVAVCCAATGDVSQSARMDARCPVYTGPVTAQEVRVRAGVGHFMEKVKAGKEVRVAYLGGSITAMNGWRNLTTDWLCATYPQAKFKEIHAAIGGTGSHLGVFRVAHDALRHNPDLLFVEFATNDSGAAPESIWRSMEGIVRQTWKKNPDTDIVFTYTITEAMKQDYLAGTCNRAASAMEQLADHYGIPSICFGPRVIDAVKDGTLVMGGKEYRNGEGKTLFAKDGVHPALAGHRLYLASVVNGFTQMKDMPPADHAAALRTPFVSDNLEAAKMVEINPSMLVGEWKKLPPSDGKVRAFSARMGEMWYTCSPGATLRFTFRGTCCQIYDLLGPDGGQVWITVDGKKSASPVARFDSYCTYHRIATLGVFSGEEGVHTVEITVDKDQPSRQPVAFRLKNPAAELAKPKYQGTKFWPAKIMLVGDLVADDLLHLSHVHRGGGKLERPDNTLETFKWCWENGSALECDCRKTKDGVGVMLHDDNLKRTGRGISAAFASKSVSKELTWDEIKDVDVGSYLDPKFAHHRIPTIEATFAAMKGHPTYLCFVDEKGAGPKYIAAKAKEAGVLDQVYYTGQNYQKALDWNKTTNGGKTLIWIGTWPRPKHTAEDIARFEAHFERKMDEMRANRFKGVSAVSLHTYYDPKAAEPFVPRASYLEKIIAEFHANGIPVCSIPFEGGETEEVYFRLHELGCDGFSTDYPSVMFSVIRKLKARTMR